MKISIITLFPEVFQPILNSSIIKRAQQKGLVEFELINLRDFGEGRHQQVDDRPYGGGAGMVLKPDVLTKALRSVFRLPTTAKSRSQVRLGRSLASRSEQKSEVGKRIILMSASGIPYKQSNAKEFSQLDHLIIICGHYEGVDQRFIENYVDEEISIGDYVLTGGEIPAMVITDSIVRLIPKVLEKEEATSEESFSPAISHLLEYPHYTRPEEFEGQKVPEVLLSGNHGEIKKWRQKESIKKTQKQRPDLLT